MATTATEIADHLAVITGAEHVRQHEGTIIVSPANTEHVAEILSYANKNHLTISPIGGATKQSWGNPDQTDIHLELRRLNRVIAHPWQDLTCTVQAGCTWQQLQQTLAKHGQFVALDPLWPERATVGGILATNDSGALRHRYGSLRDLVIGMTLVLADGTIARSGGRVVKNVAGYDLCKLLTGSLGTLAVITEATFRLHPLPQHPQSFTVSNPKTQQLAPLLASIRASHLLTQAIQLRGDSYGFHLDIELNAHPEARQSEILANLLEEGLSLTTSPPMAWQTREKLFANDNAFVVKASMFPVDVVRFGERVLSLEGAFIAQAIGVMTASFDAGTHTIAYGVDILREELAKRAGGLVILKYPNPSWSGPVANRADPSIVAVTRAVKHQFDPNRTLNPGRLLGGI